LGAEVRVGDQVNSTPASYGYASSALGPVHFGLGSAGVAAKVSIRWPSGKVQTLENVPGDRMVRVVEP
jgi:hypothetical protein